MNSLIKILKNSKPIRPLINFKKTSTYKIDKKQVKKLKKPNNTQNSHYKKPNRTNTTTETNANKWKTTFISYDIINCTQRTNI